ncbi:MAG TPA: hypothetical protein VFB50_05605 [Chloroflexota bacterium]|nr:hypothetical protein [Chloroflexota bacterium]
MSWRNGVLTPWVTLWCAQQHDHLMAPAQAEVLEASACPWCGTALRRAGPPGMTAAEYADVDARVRRKRAEVRAKRRRYALEQRLVEAREARKLSWEQARKAAQQRAYRARKALLEYWTEKIPA